MEEAGFFVGIDWATQAHEVWVEDATGGFVANWQVPNDGRGLADLCERLSNLGDADSETVSVGIEVPHGPAVETLLEREFRVFSLNPKQLDRFRDRFSVAGAKDDRLDARVLASSLRTDSHLFRELCIQPAKLIELREWSRMRSEIQEERNQLSNRIREQLRRYFPQWLQVEGDVSAGWFLDAWTLIPTPEAAQSTQAESLQAILGRRRIRKTTAKEILEVLRQRPVTVAPGTVEAATAHIELLATRLRLVCQQLRECNRRVDVLLEDLESPDEDDPEDPSDAAILRSIKGVGRVVLATLLAEAAQAVGDRDYKTLRALSGVAPITKRSGKRKQVVMRRACNPRLREALYHWARVAAQRDPTSKGRYAALRARGCSHGRALRTVGDRLLYVACAMLESGTLFQENHRAQAT